GLPPGTRGRPVGARFGMCVIRRSWCGYAGVAGCRVAARDRSAGGAGIPGAAERGRGAPVHLPAGSGPGGTGVLVPARELAGAHGAVRRSRARLPAVDGAATGPCPCLAQPWHRAGAQGPGGVRRCGAPLGCRRRRVQRKPGAVDRAVQPGGQGCGRGGVGDSGDRVSGHAGRSGDMGKRVHPPVRTTSAARAQAGQSLPEFLVVVPVFLFLVLLVFQLVLVYRAKTTLDYATREAARMGAVNGALTGPMREGLVRGLTPLYATDPGPAGIAAAWEIGRAHV